MTLIDTHAHVHFDDFEPDLEAVLARAATAGVAKMVCPGCTAEDSERAVALAAQYPQALRAAVGLHPHDADAGPEALSRLAELAANPTVVAIGECGLDQFKSTTTSEQQEHALRFQIELAQARDLPMIFHVRNAFPDFWRILDDYPDTRGVVHCFTAGPVELEAALNRGLFIALGGIMTFTKEASTLEAAKRVPLDRLVLETDCPFLAPAPVRGKRNEPANLAHTAQFLADLRSESLTKLAVATTKNAQALFNLPDGH